MIFLSHGQRQYVHPEFVQDEKLTKYSAQLVLPQLPESVQQLLDEFHRRTLHIFTLYTRYYATIMEKQLGSATVLPLSNTVFTGVDAAVAYHDTMLTTLHQSAIVYKARSPFTALSGHGDVFLSMEDLARSVRSGLYIDPYSVPVPYLKALHSFIQFSYVIPHSSGEYMLNSYIYEFFTHGSLELLRKANGRNLVIYYSNPVKKEWDMGTLGNY